MTKIGFAVASLFFAINASAQAPKSFGGFPDVPTTAKAGEFTLVPSYNWIVDAAGAKGEQTTFIFYTQKMVAPGAATSKIKFMSEEREVPNSYVVAIPKGGKAKAGDILLTWWQSGSGMQRAIVMSAADPTRPVVRYLDIGYDNPSKSRSDPKVGIGQMEEKLEADSFVQLKAGDPGSVFRCGAGDNAKRWLLISTAASGEQLMKGFAGAMKRFAKGECSAMPLKPTAKAGQMASVEMYGGFKQVKIERVDAKIGRVFVLGYDKKERAVPFGDVSP